jgi:two-component system response regulator
MPEADPMPLQVLVVEDDAGDFALVETAFAEHMVPTVLHHAEDGADALRFLRREGRHSRAPRPHLILLDLNMPGVDGRQVLAQIKADPDLKAIPVVVFTTSATPGDIVDSYRGHANAYVTKPMDLLDFERVVAEIRNFYGHTVTLPLRLSDATRHDGSTEHPADADPST